MSKKLGSLAEDLAETYFREHGYIVLGRNFRAGPGEIDLVLEKDDTVIFVEVKARRSLKYGLPQEAVTTSKQQTIRRVAEAYLQKNKRAGSEIRFDVMAITFSGRDGMKASFEHIPFAF